MTPPAAPVPEHEREQFRVDLRGIVDVLSHHLYSHPSVYLREILQNARDAISSRAELDPSFTGGRVEIEPAAADAPMVVRDDGVGLTAEEMRELLATVGGTSKRYDLEVTREKFLGQFGIGLFACFLVADTIEVRSRSARTPDAPTIRWVGHGDGTYSIDEHVAPLPGPGTEVLLRPREGELARCSAQEVGRLTTRYAEYLDVPVMLAGQELSRRKPPWELAVEEQLAWCRERLGFDPLGVVPLESSLLGVTGLAFVLPYTAAPGHRTGDRIYSRGMLVSESDDQLLPSWAFFCRAVVDAGRLSLTANREALLETTSLEHVRESLGARLLAELIMVQGEHPEVYEHIVGLHADGLTALAVTGADLRGLLRATLPLRTTEGLLTLEELARRGGQVAYVANATTYAALKDVAVHAGVLVVDASGPSAADLLRAVEAETPALTLRELGPGHVLELARPTPYPDSEAAARLEELGRAALADLGVEVSVASFRPADRPVLWWPGDQAQGGSRPPTLVLNGDNDAVVRLVEAPGRRTPAMVRALYALGLLLGGQAPSPAETRALGDALQVLAGTAQG